MGIDHITIEKLQDHVPPGMAAVYNHHDYIDEKRAALEKWAQHILALDAGLDFDK